MTFLWLVRKCTRNRSKTLIKNSIVNDLNKLEINFLIKF